MPAVLTFRSFLRGRATSLYRCSAIPALWLLLFPTICACQSSRSSFLCQAGSGTFDGEFRTGVKVHIGTTKEGGDVALATRSCSAKLQWDKEELTVANGAAALDLDAFGIDLGDGTPAAAFQVKISNNHCCAEYRVYSLEKPPRLVRTIRGGEFFIASDVDLDGRVEIWTNDAAALDGFEDLALSEFDFLPAMVLRFEPGRLFDVSTDFQNYYDEDIARARSTLQPQDVEDFRKSDGRLAAPSTAESAGLTLRRRRTKTAILEVVWGYLYSGREQDAWRSLAEMWPAADADRIRAALVKARAGGIRTQIDGILTDHAGKRKSAHIFDASSRMGPSAKTEVSPPTAIQVEIPSASAMKLSAPSNGEAFLDLVIDGAGKVRSATFAGKTEAANPELIDSAMTWKFVPAQRNGRPVACRMHIAVSPKQ